MNVETAEFVVEAQEGMTPDLEDLRETIESWGGYDYRVGVAEWVQAE